MEKTAKKMAAGSVSKIKITRFIRRPAPGFFFRFFFPFLSSFFFLSFFFFFFFDSLLAKFVNISGAVSFGRARLRITRIKSFTN